MVAVCSRVGTAQDFSIYLLAFREISVSYEELLTAYMKMEWQISAEGKGPVRRIFDKSDRMNRKAEGEFFQLV